MDIKKAQNNDLEGLRELNMRVMARNVEYDPDTRVGFEKTEEGEKFFRKMIEREDGVCLIAWENDQMIGYVNGSKKDTIAHKSRYFEIENLGVTTEKKGQGIGKQLLDAITVWAKEQRFEIIYLNCYSKNAEALNFYRNNGFEDIDISLVKKI